MVLYDIVHSCDHSDSRDVRPPRNCWNTLRERLLLQTVRDDLDLLLGQPRGQQGLCCSPRVADHPTAKSKCPILRLELGAGQQIAKLPMAANYRYSSHSGRGNKHEIRVEIEGVCYGNAVPAHAA